MATWADVERAEGAFARRVRALFDSRRHKTIATVRAEADWPGEAKIAGRAVIGGRTPDGADGDRFHADITEVVHTHLDDDATLLVVEWWTPSSGLRRVERA